MQRKLLLPLGRITQPSLWQGMASKSLRAHAESQSLGKQAKVVSLRGRDRDMPVLREEAVAALQTPCTD